MTHPDILRPYGTRPVVASLVETLAEKHLLAVHSVLTGKSIRHVYARADLCYMLADRGWHLDAIDRWFGWKPGEASEGRTRWKHKLAADMARRLEMDDATATDDEIAEEQACREARRAKRSENNAARYQARKAARAVVIEAPTPIRYRSKPLVASIRESTMLAPIRGVCPMPKPNKNGHVCGRPAADGTALCAWHSALARRAAEGERQTGHEKAGGA